MNKHTRTAKTPVFPRAAYRDLVLQNSTSQQSAKEKTRWLMVPPCCLNHRACYWGLNLQENFHASQGPQAGIVRLTHVAQLPLLVVIDKRA